jgi:cytochrome c oxidase cbb3-type subunit III
MSLARPMTARWILFAVVAVLAVSTPVALHWRAQSLLRSTLLRAIPDEIPSRPALYEAAQTAGRPAFVRHCSECHGAGEPNPLNGVPDLRDADWLYGSGRAIEIERVVLYGIRAGNSKGWNLASMPAFATAKPYDKYKTEPLTPADIDDVTEFVYSHRHSDADSAKAERGRHLYANASRGLCWDCHAPDGKGDSAIGAPNLTDAVWLYGDGSRRSIRQSIGYGRKGRCPAWVGKLPFVTIRELALYAYSLSHSPSSHARDAP